MKFRILIGFMALAYILVACRKDKNTLMEYELEGQWQIYEAYRDGSITNTLEDGYFNFVDSVMETNILGEKISGKYTLDGNTFEHQSSLPVSYTIESYLGDTLGLRTQIQGYKFRFKLSRFAGSDVDSLAL